MGENRISPVSKSLVFKKDTVSRGQNMQRKKCKKNAKNAKKMQKNAKKCKKNAKKMQKNAKNATCK